MDDGSSPPPYDRDLGLDGIKSCHKHAYCFNMIICVIVEIALSRFMTVVVVEPLRQTESIKAGFHYTRMRICAYKFFALIGWLG